MSPKNLCLPLLAILASALTATAQVNTEFKITKIEPAFQSSPSFQGVQYDKRGAKAKQWLEVEVTFEWQPRLRDPKYMDELTFNYYILLNNKSQQFPQGALLTGAVTLASIPQGRDLHTVVYVSPRSLDRFFDGKAPGSTQQALTDVGVTIVKQGQEVAQASLKGRGAWWPSYQQTPGFVLNKSETPFAPLQWDYYEAIKAKPAGQ